MGKLEGKGIQYYITGQKYYEGLFRNFKIHEEGTKYYKNGSKIVEGIFDTINTCEGIYYNPENKILYEGKN